MTIVDYLFWLSVVMLGTALLAWVRVGKLRRELLLARMDTDGHGRTHAIVLVRARAPLPLADRERILRGWEDKDERRQAMEDVMDECFAEHLADVEGRAMTAEERHYAAGALAALRHYDARLREFSGKPAEKRGPQGPQ